MVLLISFVTEYQPRLLQPVDRTRSLPRVSPLMNLPGHHTHTLAPLIFTYVARRILL